MDYLKQRVELSTLYTDTPASGTVVTVCGWAKTVRDSKKIGFISLTDGSCYKPVQVVFEADKLANYAEVAKCGLYTSFAVTGKLVQTPARASLLRSTPTRSRSWAPAGRSIRCKRKR